MGTSVNFSAVARRYRSRTATAPELPRYWCDDEPVTDVDVACLLCDPLRAASVFGRRTVWQSRLWRLSLIEAGSPVPGFGHLETVRHVPHLTDLDVEEAETLGFALARVTSVLKEVTGADLVYVYVFGERVAHLHFNLAPHRDGDALVSGPGLTRPGAPEVPTTELIDMSRQVETALGKQR
jgi:diadenosine tetraphosphate (Ap4A) HIT family hydrolase